MNGHTMTTAIEEAKRILGDETLAAQRQPTKAHTGALMQPGVAFEWRPPHAPDVDDPRRHTASLGGCNYCGSLHPTDLVAALKAGATLSWADRKYGWPHKVYVDNCPNPHEGMLEIRSSSSHQSEGYPDKRWDGYYSQHTGEKTYRYYAKPAPARATAHAKFYTAHLLDATSEEREVIERAMGLSFTFYDDGRVSWAAFDERTPEQPTI
jgi:hypothetical protein